MATIVVEDGSIVASANSYVTEAELTTFATDRGITISGTNADLLINSMDYIETREFKGLKRTRDQALQWPRTDVYIDGYYVNADSIPQDLKNAQMQTALSIDAGNSPAAVIDQKALKEKVDVIEVEYSQGSSANSIDPRINYWLRKLILSGGGLRAVKA